MSNANRSIMRRIVKKKGMPLNILLFNLPYLEKYNNLLAQTGHNFYLWTENFPGQWSYSYLAKPDNFYHLPNKQMAFDNSLDFDLVLCHGRLGQMNIAYQVAHAWHLPLYCVHHDLFGSTIISDNGLPANIVSDKLEEIKNRAGHINVASSEDIGRSWGVIGPVVKVGIDISIFKPTVSKSTKKYKCLWEPTQDNGLNQFVMSKLSDKMDMVQRQASMNHDMLVSQYHGCDFYLNLDGLTANINALEAMCCGLIPISIVNPHLLFMSNIVQNFQQLPGMFDSLKNMSNERLQPEKMASIENGRNMSNKNFVDEWNTALEQSSNFIYQR